ncbi:MAG: penicillin acylase family protein [Solirubrobacterales bacterium]
MGEARRFGVVGVLALALVAALGLAASATARTLNAEAILPPGNSGYVSIPGVASGEGSPHLTDQNQPFIDFELRQFGFNQPGESESPKPGVTITRDAFGVPRIDASSDPDAWWGVGYAAAQDRLFQLELFKRAGAGTLAEIVGPDFLDDDLIARRDYYTDAEVDAMLAEIPPELFARTEAYRDGINAYIDFLRTQRPDLTPGEFVALGVPLEDWTIRDTARTGILLARTVPSGDGNELANAQALEQIGPENFDFLHPVRTKGRIPTIKKREGKFKAQPGRTRKDERIGFENTLEFLDGIDVAGAEGPGTIPTRAGAEPVSAEAGEQPGDDLRRILPQGGSFMWAISDSGRGRGYLFNGPQLGFTIPELFWEFELHSPVQDVRGVSAAGVPLVGIGHNNRVGWGFTSGLSDEDDLFAVELTGPETYIYEGEERRMDCRNETFEFRTPPTDLPGFPSDPEAPAGSRTERICRTVQGPVQFRGDGVAYARSYAIWNRELETIVGLTELNDAKTIDDVDAAMNKVTWNENVIAVDSAGKIGYWHPGLHPLKPKRWDERLPFPGDGSAEWRGLMDQTATPRVVDPKRKWLTSWNNVPSIGWTNGDGPARERLSGDLHRVRLIQTLARKVSKNPSYERSRAIELTSGTTAQQFPFVDRKKLRRAKNRFAEGIAKRTLFQLKRWDGNYDEVTANGTTDPGVSIWEPFKDELERILLRRHGGIEGGEILAGETGNSHEYDISNGEAIALRELGPKAYARAAARTADGLAEEFGTETVKRWRAPRLLYDVGAQGAASAPDLPFFDRGTWSQSLAMG